MELPAHPSFLSFCIFLPNRGLHNKRTSYGNPNRAANWSDSYKIKIRVSAVDEEMSTNTTMINDSFHFTSKVIFVIPLSLERLNDRCVRVAYHSNLRSTSQSGDTSYCSFRVDSFYESPLCIRCCCFKNVNRSYILIVCLTASKSNFEFMLSILFMSC